MSLQHRKRVIFGGKKCEGKDKAYCRQICVEIEINFAISFVTKALQKRERAIGVINRERKPIRAASRAFICMKKKKKSIQNSA